MNLFVTFSNTKSENSDSIRIHLDVSRKIIRICDNIGVHSSHTILVHLFFAKVIIENENFLSPIINC